jgi:mRNA interferase MazF
MNTAEFNRAGIKLIVAAITSNLSPPSRPGDFLLNDWRSAGLLKPSAVRGILATVDQSDVSRKLGKLSESDLFEVEKAIASIIRLQVVPSP